MVKQCVISPRTAAYLTLRDELDELKEQEAAKEDPTKIFLETLKNEISDEVEKSMQATRNEVVALKQSIEEAFAAKAKANARNGELRNIKGELEQMRKQLHRKSSRLQVLEDGRLQRISSSSLLTSRRRSPSGGILKAKASVLKDEPPKSTRSTTTTNCKRSVKARTDHEATKQDLKLLQAHIDDQTTQLFHGKSQDQLENIKAAVKTIQSQQIDSKTSDEIGEIKTELTMIKEQLRERREASKITKEIVDLKLQLGKLIDTKKNPKEEEDKKVINEETTADIIPNNSLDVSALTEKINQLEQAHAPVKQDGNSQDYAALHTMNQQLKVSEDEPWSELKSIKNILTEINLRKIRSTKRKEAEGRDMVAIQADLESMKKELQLRRGLSTRVRQELDTMKAVFEEELADVAKRSEDEIAALKFRIEELTVKSEKVEETERKEGGLLKKELAVLRKNMGRKLRAESDLEYIKCQIRSRLAYLTDENDRKYLQDMKKIVDGIDVESADLWNEDEWSLLGQGIASLKKKLIHRDDDRSIPTGSIMGGKMAEFFRPNRRNMTYRNKEPSLSDIANDLISRDEIPVRKRLSESSQQKSRCSATGKNVRASHGFRDVQLLAGSSKTQDGSESVSAMTDSIYSHNHGGSNNQDGERKTLFGRILRMKSPQGNRHRKIRIFSPQRLRPDVVNQGIVESQFVAPNMTDGDHGRHDREDLDETSSREEISSNEKGKTNMRSNDRRDTVLFDKRKKSNDSDERSSKTNETDIESQYSTSSSSTENILNDISSSEELAKFSACSTMSTPRTSNRTEKSSSSSDESRSKPAPRHHSLNMPEQQQGTINDDRDEDALIDALFAKRQSVNQPHRLVTVPIPEETSSETPILSDDSCDSEEDSLITTVYTGPKVYSPPACRGRGVGTGLTASSPMQHQGQQMRVSSQIVFQDDGEVEIIDSATTSSSEVESWRMC